MDLRNTLGRDRRIGEEDLNITPVMNIFLILVPFLLLTAVFVNISILEFSLPNAEQAKQAAVKQKPVVTILAITESGFELKTQGDRKFPILPRKADDFDYTELIQQLSAVKEIHPQTEDIILAPSSEITYETIIKVMDRCRENGFLNISIAA